MRLNRLDLIRYGKFAGKVLDFGTPGDGPDVTLVYGPNEAGKSTAFAAWLDLLYGLPLQHPHAFRFERKDLMVGAEIRVGGETVTLRRTGARQSSLTDEQGRAMDEHRLATWLHGLDRTAYQTRFSLNEAVLREGGEEIARAHGDLGRLLHAGTSGLSGVTTALDGLESDVDRFHMKGGRATVLAEGKKRLAEIDLALRDIRLDPSRFDALRLAVSHAEADLAEATRTRDRARATLLLRQAADTRRKLAAEKAALRSDLAELPDGPDLPEGALAALSASAARRDEAGKRLAEAERRAHEADAARAELADDEPGLHLAATLEALDEARFENDEALMPRVITAADDISHRRAEQVQLAARARETAVRIAGDDADPAEVLLQRAMIAELRAAAEAVRDAERSLAQGIETHDEAKARLGPEVAVPDGLTALSDALDQLDRLGEDPEALKRRADELRHTALHAAIGLPPSWPDLVAAGLPTEGVILDLLAHHAKAADAALRARDNLGDAKHALAVRHTDRDQISAGDSVLDDAELDRVRSNRDGAWAAHRLSLTEASADDFHAAMRADDRARERHAGSAEDRLELKRLVREIAQQTEALARLRQTEARANEELTAASADVAALARRLGLPDNTPAEHFRETRAHLVEAARADLEATEAEARVAAAGAAREMVLAAIRTAMGADIPGEDERLIPEARRRLESWRAAAETARVREKTLDSLDGLARQISLRTRDLAARQAKLRNLTAGLWCRGLDAGAILRSMADLEALATLASEQEQLDRRIGQLERALATFTGLAPDLRDQLGLEVTVPLSAVIAAARNRARDATELSARIAQLAEVGNAARREAEAAGAARTAAEVEIDRWLAGQSVADEPLEQVIHRLARRETLRSTLADVKRRYDQAGEGYDPVDLAAEEGNPSTERTLELASAAELKEDDVKQAAVALGQAREALRAALGSSGGAELDQQRATLLETLQDGARIAAAELLGLMAARGALRRFRHERRGAMLEATEHAFARLTRGEWPALQTQPMGKTERLVALRNGEPVAADAMSTGTRGQLYLALRIAGHADFVGQNGPLPFITDDIHETFDDHRASAAIELAAEMGARGQAILFTHHRHLVELARAVLPDVRVIELASDGG